MVFVSLKQYNVCTTGYEGVKYNEQEYRSLQTLKWVLIGHREAGEEEGGEKGRQEIRGSGRRRGRRKRILFSL